MLKPRVALRDLNGAGNKVPAYFNAPQLIPALRQRRVQRFGKAVVGRIIHPIPAFHEADGLIRRAQLGAVFIVY